MNPQMKPGLKRLLAGTLLAVAMASAWGADDSAVRFEISRFEVEGNTLLPQAEVDAAVSRYAGKERGFGDIKEAQEALEKAYRDKGYKLVVIELPEQELNGGVVTLRVEETKVGRVTVRDNRYVDEANIRRSLPALKEGQPPDLDAVSANLKQGNESQARKVTMRLQGGEDKDRVDVVLDVQDESPWKIMGSAANTGNASTGRTQLAVALQNANLFGRDHLATLQYITSAEEPGRVKVYGASYHIPFYALGDSLDLYASYSNIDSGTINAGLFNLAVSGKGSAYGARYNQALVRRSDFSSTLSYGIDVKAFKNSVQFAGVELGNDVTVHPVSIGYQANAPIRMGEVAGLVTLLHNIPGGPNGDRHAFMQARMNAKADYSILRMSGSITRALANDWQLRAIANGQYTRDALVPGEQFGAGGAASVRGFLEREFANDSGLAVNLEAYTPNLCPQAGWNCRLLGFYDTAHLSRNKALPGELDSLTIASVGVGVRFVLSGYANLQLDYGHVINAGITPRADSNRLHARLALAY
ncbi:hemolysin activation/secretion protein [Herbaspirillum sp. SJZ130]|nr:hemolysin activation/secretion protein [Herbaspirillum sp. SJZ130]TQK08609.1 hemolysin activation/secretion protein [Herbaspirillum sp. SJZ106]